MILDNCSQGCGLIAAFLGTFGHGSFGVPLKGEAANRVNADPFVLQTYKSAMCFLTCWLALLLGEEFNFTPLGIISGILWVSGGIAGIYGIRNAGLAISVGTWSGVTVLGSFAWGIFVFGERVHSIHVTFLGVCLMMTGFVGMSYFSSPKVSDDDDEDEDVPSSTEAPSSNDAGESSGNEYESDESNDGSGVMFEAVVGETGSLTEPLLQNIEEPPILQKIEEEHNNQDNHDNNDSQILNANRMNKEKDKDKVIFLGREWNRRTLGIIGAAVDGLLGGSTLVPMHYSNCGGLEYVMSFACGAAIVTLLGWILRLAYNTHRNKSLQAGWEALPSLHIQELTIPGAIAGTSWSIGNIGCILSVTYLGESIGMSLVQCQMIVSGAWGILWFGEIRHWKAITGWMISAIITLTSMIILGREHVS